MLKAEVERELTEAERKDIATHLTCTIWGGKATEGGRL